MTLLGKLEAKSPKDVIVIQGRPRGIFCPKTYGFEKGYHCSNALRQRLTGEECFDCWNREIEDEVNKMKIMKFDEFDKYIQKVKTYMEVDSVVNGELNKLNDDFAKFSCLGLIDEVLCLLEYIFDDQETNWIYYYCFDLDFGIQNDKYKVYSGEGKDEVEIPLTTTQDLYNLLVKNMAENEPRA